MNEDEGDMAFQNLRRSGRAKKTRLPSLSSSSPNSTNFCEVVLTEVKREETEDRIEMDFDGFDLLCLICGNYISSSCLGRNGSSRTEDEEDPANGKSTILTEFIKELELGVHEERISDLFGLFEERTNSPVCWSCFSKIRSAVEKKRRRDEMEVVVRDLQEKLLEKLHLLDGFVDQYYLEMESIAKFVRNSTQSQPNMDRKISEFQRHILKVVDDLHIFQKGLRKKLPSLPILQVRGNEQDYENNDFEPEPVMGVQYIVSEGFEESGNASTHGIGKKTESHKTRGHEKSLDGENTKKRKRKRAGVRNGEKGRTDEKRLRKKLPWLPTLEVRENKQGCEGDGENSDDDDFEPEPLEEEVLPDCVGEPRNASNLELGLEENIESHKTRDREKSLDDQKTKKRNRKRAGFYNESLDAIESSLKDEIPEDSSFLKKHFILRAYQSEQNEKEDIAMNDLLPIIHPVKYNSETAILSVGDVELIFPENNSNSVQCSSCDFVAQTEFQLTRIIAGKLEREIISHIHYTHFHSFDCKLCPSKLPSLPRYTHHMKRCHGTPVKCKFCEKPLKKVENLAEHEWTHKNEEERAEAERNGDVVPKRFQKETIERSKLAAKDRVPCEICGRQLLKREINRHIKRMHSESRPIIVCPLCGKTVLKDTYDVYHKLYVCPLPGTGMAQGMTQLGEQHRIQCLHCPITFKAKRFLKIHTARFHSEEGQKRSFLCSVCGKGYKSRGDLQFHMRIHQEDRPWKCKFGCGKDFNVKRNCGRHEVTCSKKAMKFFPEEI